jgi:hypothetical protein
LLVLGGIVFGGGNLGADMAENKRKYERKRKKLQEEGDHLRRIGAQRYEVDRVDRELGRNKQEVKSENEFHRYHKKY